MIHSLLILKIKGKAILVGSGGTAPPFLTPARDGGEQSASCPGCFTSGENHPKYPLDWRLGEPQSWCGFCREEKNSAMPGIESGPSIAYSVTVMTPHYRYLPE